MKVRFNFYFQGNKVKKDIILVVDDSEEMKKSISNLLINNDRINAYEIVSANDGSELIHLVSQDQYNGNKIKLVLTDEEMKFLNGSEAVNILKKMESEYKVKPIKYVSLTSHDSSQHERLYSIGFNKVLEKPFKKNDIKFIKELLNID